LMTNWKEFAEKLGRDYEVMSYHRGPDESA